MQCLSAKTIIYQKMVNADGLVDQVLDAEQALHVGVGLAMAQALHAGAVDQDMAAVQVLHVDVGRRGMVVAQASRVDVGLGMVVARVSHVDVLDNLGRDSKDNHV